jgi:hypothetical protein
MKKLAIATLGLAVLSTSAFASKARLEALGQDANGSQWIDDQRNVFLNPAHLNTHYDWMTLEWGDTAEPSDATATPRAEGGIFKNAGNMIYGLYLGAEANDSNLLRRAAGLGATDDEMNNLDLFVGGDAGVQWGARLTHSAYDDGADRKNSAMRLGLGVVSGNIDAFLRIGLSNTAEDGTNEFTGDSSTDLGVTYAMGDLDLMVRAISFGGENEGGDKYTESRTHVGVGKTYKLNDKATAWTSAFYKMENKEDFAGTETKKTFLPVTVGMEVAAKDWLAFRGAIEQNVLIGSQEVGDADAATIADTTSVTAGMSLIFGDFNIDGMIGNTSDTAVAGDDTAAQNGTLRTDTLMSRVSMNYKF